MSMLRPAKCSKNIFYLTMLAVFLLMPQSGFAECKCQQIYTPCAPCEGMVRKVKELLCKRVWCADCCSGVYAPEISPDEKYFISLAQKELIPLIPSLQNTSLMSEDNQCPTDDPSEP